MDKLEMSLDDIVKKTNTRSGRKSSNNQYGKQKRNNRFAGSRSTPYNRTNGRNNRNNSGGNRNRNNIRPNNRNNRNTQSNNFNNMSFNPNNMNLNPNNFNPALLFNLLLNSMNMNTTNANSANTNVPRNSNSRNNRSQGFQIDDDGDPLLKVSQTSNPKNVAGSISHVIRSSANPKLLATGYQCVGIAVKALCIARDYLQDDALDFSVIPEVTNQKKGSTTFYINRTKLGRDQSETKTIKVAASSEPKTVAGAIAGGIRDGERICMTFIGPDCANVAVRSVDMARQYLKDESWDLSFKPRFVHINMGGREVSGIEFHLLAYQI